LLGQEGLGVAGQIEVVGEQRDRTAAELTSALD
jgi:hypothetical protein